jgi:hypothetical protein
MAIPTENADLSLLAPGQSTKPARNAIVLILVGCASLVTALEIG